MQKQCLMHRDANSLCFLVLVTQKWMVWTGWSLLTQARKGLSLIPAFPAGTDTPGETKQWPHRWGRNSLSEILRWKRENLKCRISHTSKMYQRLSLSVAVQLDAQLCSKHRGRAKGQTMPGTQCRAHVSLGHGSLFRWNHFSNKFIRLKTVACIQYPQNGWELYCHWQYQAVSMNTDPQKTRGRWGRFICKREAVLDEDNFPSHAS